MKRIVLVLLILGSLAAGCSPPGSDNGSDGTAAPGLTPPPASKSKPLGKTYKMGTIVKTEAGSFLTVRGWAKGAPERGEAPGPGQVYETIGLEFCAGPDVDVSGREIVHLFFLELPNGNRVSPDSITGKKEMRAKGKIAPATCVRAPIVYQVGGGTKPSFVVFESRGVPATKWIVP